MLRLTCAVLLLAVATASSSESRVVGGFPAWIEDFPNLVQIERSLAGVWRQHAAGCILTSRTILTAASTIIGPDFVTNLRRVRAGSTYRNIGGQLSSVARFVKHPSWNEGADLGGNIGVIFLWTSLQYSPVVQQSKILAQGAFVPDNMPAIQAGWGLTLNEHFPSLFPDRLHSLDVYTVNHDRCAYNYASSSLFPLTVTPDTICAGQYGDAGACIGDQGGPLFITDIVVGIKSWSRSCTNSTYPTVHTSVPSYADWIVATASQ